MDLEGGVFLKIKLNVINDINIFVNVCSRYYDGIISVQQGWQIVNAKSLLGMYSLDLSHPIDVVIHTDDERVKNDFYNYINKWKVEDEM